MNYLLWIAETQAQKAFNRAASLTDHPALREYLFKRSAGNI